jgi:hypothetical protein
MCPVPIVAGEGKIMISSSGFSICISQQYSSVSYTPGSQFDNCDDCSGSDYLDIEYLSATENSSNQFIFMNNIGRFQAFRTQKYLYCIFFSN